MAEVEAQVKVQSVTDWIASASAPLLLAQRDANSLLEFLAKAESLSKTERFISDSKLLTLILSYSASAGFFFEFEVVYRGSDVLSVIIIKNDDLVASKPLGEQLLAISLKGDSPVEDMHAYVRNSLAPFFRSFVDTEYGEQKKRAAVTAIQSHLSQLERSLYNCKQSIDIEEVHLVPHPLLQSAADAVPAGQQLKPESLGEKGSDAAFLNELQACVVAWIKSIEKVTKIGRIETMPAEGSTLEEIKFWTELEAEVLRIEQQLKLPIVQCTLALLKRARRFHATGPFDTDSIGVRAALQKCAEYRNVVRGFPILEITGATDLSALPAAIKHIFEHLDKTKKGSEYPLPRYITLIEALSRDVCTKVLDILQLRRLMVLDFKGFSELTSAASQVFNIWSSEFEEFRTGSMRKLAKKRSQDRLPFKPDMRQHDVIKERLRELVLFRKTHEDLRSVIEHTGAGARAMGEVDEAFSEMMSVEVLDLSAAGAAAWADAKRRYDARIDHVETRIASGLRDRLAVTKNAQDMFRVFGQFNAELFNRPRIKGAITEYQAHLISKVKEDIGKLHKQLISGYQTSSAFKMSKLRDIPPVAGRIVWLRQLSRQLESSLSRVETVLGSNWHLDIEGQKLKSDGDGLRAKLDTDGIFKQWVAHTQGKDFEVKGALLEVVRRAGKLHLEVRFDDRVADLFKEVRQLQWLGFRIPFTITLLSSGAKQVYPFAVSLKEIIRTYNQTRARLTDQTSALVAGFESAVQGVLSDGFRLRWDMLSKLEPFVARLFGVVNTFAVKVEEARQANETIRAKLAQLDTCKYEGNAFANVLGQVQSVIDELNLGAFSNLGHWVSELSKEVGEKLASRLQNAVNGFVHAMETDGSASDQTELPLPTLQQSVHEILIRNQVMYVQPPMEAALQSLSEQFSQWLSVVCNQQVLQGSRYDQSLSLDGEPTAIPTFIDLLDSVPRDLLLKAYALIDERLQTANSYVSTWLNYQALWDMDAAMYTETVGEDLSRWHQLLVEVKQARRVFDNADQAKDFFPIKIDYQSVRNLVNNKYDFWHRDILHNFGNRVATAMAEFYGRITKLRSEMESHSIESDSTASAVSFIIQLQDTKRDVTRWDAEVQLLGASQDVLTKQRFAFPSEWLQFAMVDAEWQAFKDLLRRREKSLTAQIPVLQEKILKEAGSVGSKIESCCSEWTERRPRGAVAYTQALEVITIFSQRVRLLKEEHNRISQAKQALGLDELTEERLDPMSEELADLQEVWGQLGVVWKAITALKDMPWGAIVPRKVRSKLEELIDELKAMPAKVKLYESFEILLSTVQSYLTNNGIVTDLKSEALRERHWRELRKRLRSSWVHADLTLGHIWDADLKKNGHIFKDLIQQAQGELALEIFLKQISEYWETFELDLVNYRNKTKLIRGWDDLFSKMTDHLQSISTMKMSPFYRVFEAEAASWDDKLSRLFALFDIWIDVQRRWVYLEGIFSGSAEISQLLPVETSRFRSINNEFVGLMRKVQSLNGSILDVMAIDGVQKSMDRLLDLLTKIQKALGEYLERQRAGFPRFYFVGDEDLLEVIGSSKDPIKIQRHFKKMFAGLTSVEMSEDGQKMIAMCSKEGEVIKFPTPVEFSGKKINEWLSALESQMRLSLSAVLGTGVAALKELTLKDLDGPAFLNWVDVSSGQVGLLAFQIQWTSDVERALADPNTAKAKLEAVNARSEATLEVLSDGIIGDLTPILRHKYENLITELVHQRDVVRHMLEQNVTDVSNFHWVTQMRFYWENGNSDPLKRCVIHMANASFYYGWEYLGVPDRLVQTPLTDRTYLTLTQALEGRFGGSPAGPAGTGKTETVKALGGQLGRFVLVFCCDENFDYQAMGRIFVGLCETSSWGCFDEFNRLEERILSAVSQQIQQIQEGLRVEAPQIDLAGRNINLGRDTGIFITMNPGYAGRQNLPDNLKQLFRGIAMIKPDQELIGQVMLFSQGFKTAERLAAKVVPLFTLCKEQLSKQSHYDWGLRATKSVLVSAGNLKRQVTLAGKDVTEEVILIQSICESIIPKLLHNDIILFRSLLSDVFPGSSPPDLAAAELRKHVRDICEAKFLQPAQSWMNKVVQLHDTLAIRHGVMLVGPSGSGKTTAWRTLLAALERIDDVDSVCHVIDPKAIPKDMLFGTLEPTTREWTDGIFTHTLRKIIENVRGEANQRHWIVFDGDVDPEWVENLNSVLDDNKLLTLPNGERLALPSNIRILFEVEGLRYATPATVSRCGMIWFSEDVVSLDMVFYHFLATLGDSPLEEDERELYLRKRAAKAAQGQTAEPTPGLLVQRACAKILQDHFTSSGMVASALEWARKQWHIMEVTPLRLLNASFSLINRGILNVIDYNREHPDFPMESERVQTYTVNRLVFSLLWGMGGSMKAADRVLLGDALRGWVSGGLPDQSGPPLIDYYVDLEDGAWRLWDNKVPRVEIETHQAASPDVVIPTVDTIRHEEVIHAWLSEHRPLLLCGPPGSGKTMTLFATLKQMDNIDVVTLNFSSATTPELLQKTFDHHCEYRVTPKGTVLRPIQPGKWLVVFCDEINLPSTDKYGTQRVITFLRQLTERNGFYRPSDHAWITLERIQFVGACNPPTDPGRVPLSNRFLRFAPLLMVDFPTEPSLHQIYGTFNRALLKLVPEQRGEAKALTTAMVDLYLACQHRFTADMHPHYIFSPRELSRWIRALHEAIQQWDSCTIDELVRLWVHEGLRLFQDRLVEKSERDWLDTTIDELAHRHFPTIGDQCLARPILYSTWTTKQYQSVDRDQLRQYVKARLRIFYEEELDVPLVLFNEVLDHILRIDRVFRQPQGHALLIGVSGGGKTVLSRFVAWLNGLQVAQIKVNNRYTADDFRADLRNVMLRSGTKDEKICFIFDESNVLESNFLELMNTLLASGDVPGLFEGEDYTALMHACKDAISRRGLVIDQDDLYSWFVKQVRLNLHIVFTMNPASPDFHNRAATSPALFNRCVLDWFGDWSPSALYQVAEDFTKNVDLDMVEYKPPSFVPEDVEHVLSAVGEDAAPSHRSAVVSTLVHIHHTVRNANVSLLKRTGRHNYLTPRHFLDLIKQFTSLVAEKREQLEEQQLHLNVGLRKLVETEEEVSRLQESLSEKGRELEVKGKMANEKLQQMVGDQQEAEKKRTESLKLKEQLKVQTAEVDVKKAAAQADLAKAEPAVEEAKKSVASIQKRNLDEMRALRKPPAKIQMVMQATTLMLGHGILDWTGIRKLLADSSFIPSVVNFDSKNIPKDVREQLRAKYLSNPDFNFEAANRASRACGPLVKWLLAQLQFSELLNSIKPLREEVARLEKAAKDMQVQSDELDATIASLEEKIGVYKEEYAALIRETELIKNEMDSVKTRVDRSVSLLQNLSSESTRWKAQSQSFQQQMSTVVGDCLASSAFLSYIGVFDQGYRKALMSTWRQRLTDMHIQFRDDVSTIEYLAEPDERLEWRQNALPADDLCVENAVMLKRFNRYPLIIDPSGQATQFLLNQYRDKKVIHTSFLDSKGFMKNLESALRFGCPIVVEDVENIDPVLNPVLNKEVRKTGGRVLITLGDQDIDFSPSFVIYMTTRDPTSHFTPDLCSRVTFVNFTVTRSGLQSQCLSEMLRSERPDVEKKRTDALKQQGEFRVKLRNLEKQLLDSLSNSQGNLLSNDAVLQTLERLKGEAADVATRMDAAKGVMEELMKISVQFQGAARACSDIYFALEQLSSVHFLYQFSLAFFLDIFHWVIGKDNPALNGVTDPKARLDVICKSLYRETFSRVSRTLLNEDQVVLAVRLVQSYVSLDDSKVAFMLRGGEQLVDPKEVAGLSDSLRTAGVALSATQARLLCELQKVAGFEQVTQLISQNAAEWTAWLSTDEPQPPQSFPVASDSVSHAVNVVCLAKTLKADRLVIACRRLVSAAFGDEFLELDELDLGAVVDKEATPRTPLLLCATQGHDAGRLVDELASQRNIRLERIALGSAEGFEMAERAIGSASKTGSWVMLKNVHLAPSWLGGFEKRLHSLTPNASFRVFLTSDIHPRLPASLLRHSRVISFQSPPGVRANLLHTLSLIPTEQFNRAPAERGRLHFLLAWLHALITERVRYAPLGWSKKFEFSETDFQCALDTLSYWVDLKAQDRPNLAPDKIPWTAVRQLLSQVVYGGRIDNEVDQRLLDAFLDKTLTAKSFEDAFNIGGELTMPAGSKKSVFIDWIHALPNIESPSWLGLSPDAELLLLEQEGKSVAQKLLKMQSVDEESVPVESEGEQSTESSSARSAWMTALDADCAKWLDLLPKEAPVEMKATEESLKKPLWRFWRTEVQTGIILLNKVRSDLEKLRLVCKGELNQTNEIRALITSIQKSEIPEVWAKYYTVPSSLTLSLWLIDLVQRIETLVELSNSDSEWLSAGTVWLGGLTSPAAFITASRQAAAQANGWSLEMLELRASVIDSKSDTKLSATTFAVSSIISVGTKWDSKQGLVAAEEGSIGLVQFQWHLKTDEKPQGLRASLPVYLDTERKEYLFSISLPLAQGTKADSLYQRGAALLAWSPRV